jgi:competence protein ComEC
MIISHLDSDHSGGAASVLAGASVARVLSSISPDSPALAGARNPQPCKAGQTVIADELVMRMLHPDAADYAQPRSTNAMSCVVEVRSGTSSVLLTGDIPAAEEAAMLKREPLAPVTWMAVPHHGSRSSSSEALLAAAQPRWAVVQSGYRNRFGHPDAQVVARYQRHGIKLERTDRAGALQWRFGADGEVRLLRWRQQAMRYWHDRPDGGFDRSNREPTPAGDDATDDVPRDPFIGG